MKLLLVTLLMAFTLAGCATSKLTPAEQQEREEKRMEIQLHGRF